jgi:hypothetical protein
VRALEVLRRSGRQLVLWGGVLPLALAVLAFAVPPAAAAALGLGAVPALLAGSFMKFVLITRAGYNQGYALRRTSRGGGAAPAIKPGWASPASLKESS